MGSGNMEWAEWPAQATSPPSGSPTSTPLKASWAPHTAHFPPCTFVCLSLLSLPPTALSHLSVPSFGVHSTTPISCPPMASLSGSSSPDSALPLISYISENLWLHGQKTQFKLVWTTKGIYELMWSESPQVNLVKLDPAAQMMSPRTPYFSTVLLNLLQVLLLFTQRSLGWPRSSLYGANWLPLFSPEFCQKGKAAFSGIPGQHFLNVLLVLTALQTDSRTSCFGQEEEYSDWLRLIGLNSWGSGRVSSTENIGRNPGEVILSEQNLAIINEWKARIIWTFTSCPVLLDINYPWPWYYSSVFMC